MPKKNTDMLLVVRGDHNDADFITQITPITQEQLDRYLPLIEAIKKFKPYKGMSDSEHHGGMKPMEFSHDHNWGVGEYGYRPDLGAKSITELYGELAEEFDQEYVPHAEEWNIHTIVEIVVVKLEKKIFTNSNHYKNWAIF
jgi:hypothetical protein